VSLGCAAISCGGAVFTWLFLRGGEDQELRADVEELSLLVERLAKTSRREKMARVRTVAEEPQAVMDYAQDPKNALRARLRQLQRGS
jgi:hypothetical protein